MATSRSAAVILYDANGVAMAVQDGVAIPVGTSAVLAAGSDGTDARFLRTSSDGTIRVDPTGTTTQPVSVGTLPLPSGAATEAKQDTLIGHVDGLEALAASLDAKDYATEATLASQLDITLSSLRDALRGIGGKTLTDLETTLDGLRTDFNAEDFATSSKQDTIIGHVDGIEGLLATIDTVLDAINAKDFATETTLSSQLNITLAALRDSIAGAGPNTNTIYDLEQTLESIKTFLDNEDFASATNQSAIIGHLDEVEAYLTSIDGKDFATEATLSTRATEATQDAIRDNIGEAVVSPAANTLLARLQSLIDQITSIKDTDGIKKITDELPAGTQEIGAVAQGTKAAGADAWPVSLYDPAGNSAVASDGMLLSRIGTAVISTGNSTEVPLGADEEFIGDWEESYFFSGVTLLVRADQASADDGLVLEYSVDGTTADDDDVISIPADNGKFFAFPLEGRYFRIRYLNGSVAQSVFRLQTIYHQIPSKPSSHTLKSVLVDDDDAELVKAVISGRSSDGLFRNATVTTAGQLLVSTPPPVAPSGTTPVVQSVFDGVSNQSELVYVIPDGELLSIVRLRGTIESSVGSGQVELIYRPTGLPASDVLLEVGIGNGNNFQFDLAEEFLGDGTAQIVLRRTNSGGGTLLIYGKWDGYLA